MKKINVKLYGGKSIFKGVRETPLEAEITYCDKCEQCSFYKNGECFNAGRWKSNCKIGRKEIVKGYTSRASKYYDFKRNWEKDECYYKLKEPNTKIGIVEDIVVLNLELIKIIDDLTVVEDVGFGKSGLVYIPLQKFTNDIIKQICDIRPRTIFDNVPIKRYYEEIIPRFLYELKSNFNDIYTRFINEYPRYNKQYNFVGRKAYIYTLNDNITIKDGKYGKYNFLKSDGYLIGEFKSAFLPFDANKAEIKMKIAEDMVCEIEDNSWVNENTKFAD